MNIKFVVGFFLLILGTFLFALVRYPNPDVLQVIACDVGQGDGFLIVNRNYQIVIDGGANRKILKCMDKYLPFWDRNIELVILTHPQEDHYKGLIDLFERFQIQNFILPQINSSNESFGVLKNRVREEGSSVIFAQSGQQFRVGLIYLDILWPDMQFFSRNLEETENFGNESKIENLYETKIDPNDFSIVIEAKYKNFDMLFTGDINPQIINQLLESSKIGDIEYLKVPHHGSRNGLTKDLLDATKPEIAVISVGKNNSHRHPHREVVQLLNERVNVLFRTDLEGDVAVFSDGEKIWFK